MIRVVILLCTLWPIQAFSQWAISKTKATIKKQLESRPGSEHTALYETDTSLHYSIRDPNMLPADFIYTFDGAGKCNSEKWIASCDSCLKKFLRSALQDKRWGWKKLNDHAYVSFFSKRMMLEIPATGTDPFLFIRRMGWTRDSYRTILRSAE